MPARLSAAIVLIAAGMALALPAQAEETAAAPRIAAEDVSTGQIVSFVNAMIALERVRREFQPKLETAETDAERAALSQEADAAAKAAVKKVVGITPEEYLAIGHAAEGNAELAARIEARIAELVQNQSKRRSLKAVAPAGSDQTQAQE